MGNVKAFKSPGGPERSWERMATAEGVSYRLYKLECHAMLGPLRCGRRGGHRGDHEHGRVVWKAEYDDPMTSPKYNR